jgi:hypothetical protein
VYINVVDQPALLSGMGIAAAGEGGHAPVIPLIGPAVKSLQLGA